MNNINNTTAMNKNANNSNTAMDMATKLTLASIWLADNFVTKTDDRGNIVGESKALYWDNGTIFKFCTYQNAGAGSFLMRHYYTANGNATDVMEVVLTTTETKASALIVKGNVMDATKYQPKVCRAARH
jgi:hypothetical protein